MYYHNAYKISSFLLDFEHLRRPRMCGCFEKGDVSCGLIVPLISFYVLILLILLAWTDWWISITRKHTSTTCWSIQDVDFIRLLHYTYQQVWCKQIQHCHAHTHTHTHPYATQQKSHAASHNKDNFKKGFKQDDSRLLASWRTLRTPRPSRV